MPPPLSAEQRRAAAQKAVAARRCRAELKARIKGSAAQLPAVLEEGRTDESIGRARLVDLLTAIPGIGPARAAQVMAKLGIAPNRRVRGLGVRQRAALEREFAPREPPGPAASR